MFDSDGGDVRHHGQQIQIFLGELVHEVRRVEIDEPDDTVVGLQWNRQHAANLLLHDAHALGESLIEAGVANQQRRLLVDHPIAHHAADAESFAACGTHHQLVTFHGHQYTACSADGVDRKIHDEVEKVV